MAEKQIVQRTIEGKNIYEYSGDFGGTLAIVENDPLYIKITDVLTEAENLAKSMLDERAKNTTLKDSVMVSYEPDRPNSIQVISLSKNVAYSPDIHGIIPIGEWLMIVNASDIKLDTYTMLVYRPCGNIESARYVPFDKANNLVVNFMEVTDGTKYVEIARIPKDLPKKEAANGENITVEKLADVTVPTKEAVTDAEVIEEAPVAKE